MNDFENNINQNENSTSEPAENTKDYASNTGSDMPEGSTFSSTYSPENRGYSNQGNTNPTCSNSYSYYTPEGYTAPIGDFSPTPKKKASKAGYIAIAICGFLVVALSVGLFGCIIAKTSSLLNSDLNITDDEGEKIVLNSNEDKQSSEKDGEQAKDNNEDKENPPATISKNEAASDRLQGGSVGETMTKAQVAALVKDSVVEITTEQVVNGNSFYQYVQSGAGSGVIIAKEGYVITNNHVISEASKVVVRLTNGNEYEAELIGTDASTDIAVLKIDPDEALTVAILGSSASLQLAEEILDGNVKDGDKIKLTYEEDKVKVVK